MTFTTVCVFVLEISCFRFLRNRLTWWLTKVSRQPSSYTLFFFLFRLFVIFTSVKRIEGWARQWVSSMPYIGEGLIGLRGRGEEIHRVGLFDLFFLYPPFHSHFHRYKLRLGNILTSSRKLSQLLWQFQNLNSRCFKFNDPIRKFTRLTSWLSVQNNWRNRINILMLHQRHLLIWSISTMWKEVPKFFKYCTSLSTVSL